MLEHHVIHNAIQVRVQNRSLLLLIFRITQQSKLRMGTLLLGLSKTYHMNFHEKCVKLKYDILECFALLPTEDQ